MLGGVCLLKRPWSTGTQTFGPESPTILTQLQVLGRLLDHRPVFSGNVVESDQLRLNRLQLAANPISEFREFLGAQPARSESIYGGVVGARGALLTFFDLGHLTADIGKPAQRRGKRDDDRNRRNDDRGNAASRWLVRDHSTGDEHPSGKPDDEPGLHGLAEDAVHQCVVDEEYGYPGPEALEDMHGYVSEVRWARPSTSVANNRP